MTIWSSWKQNKNKKEIDTKAYKIKIRLKKIKGTNKKTDESEFDSRMNGTILEITDFQMLIEAAVSDEDCKAKILSRMAQTRATLANWS